MRRTNLIGLAISRFQTAGIKVCLALGVLPMMTLCAWSDGLPVKPTVWYRPGTGVVTDSSGAVIKWINEGTLGSSADVLQSNSSKFTGRVSMTAETFAGTEMSIPTFTGDAYLVTLDATNLGRTADVKPTIYLVYKPDNRNVDGNWTLADAGAFGAEDNNCRLGAFFPKTYNGQRIRSYLGGNDMYVETKLNSGVWQVLEVSAPDNDMTVAAVLNGADPVSRNGSGYSTGGSRFKIGHFREDAWGSPFLGEIAEIRIYVDRLTYADRVVIREELAAKYGTEKPSIPFFDDARSADYRNDVYTIGHDENGQCGEAGESSGGLSLQLANWNWEKNEIWVGHNGSDLGWMPSLSTDIQQTLARVWYFGMRCEYRSNMKMTFRLDALDEEASYVLMYREQSEDDWIVLPYPVQVGGGCATAFCPSGAVGNGYYTLGKCADGFVGMPRLCSGVQEGLTGWYRADAGTVIADDRVISWRNLGGVGSEADMVLADDEQRPEYKTGTFVRAGTDLSEASVGFGGKPIFETARQTHWNMRSCDNSWFVVYSISPTATGDNRKNLGLFGNKTVPASGVNEVARYGAFVTGSPYNLRAHALARNNTADFINIEGATDPGAKGLVASRRWGTTVDSQLNGKSVKQLSSSDLPKSPLTDTYRIGGMLSTLNGFRGDIAEVRVYNRTINDAERVIIENHLAARYGLTLADHFVYRGMLSENGDYDLDVIGVGSSQQSMGDSWKYSGEARQSDSSSGLTLTAVGTIDDGAFVLAGHKEKTNKWVKLSPKLRVMSRKWYVAKKDADNLSLQIAFDLALAGVEAIEDDAHPQYALYRCNGDMCKPVEGVALTKTECGFEAILSAGQLEEGIYTLGAEVRPKGLILIFR